MRILVAEDEVALARVLTAILKKNNYSVDTVYNGKDAEDYMRSGLYDLALLDVMMPVEDGISALKNIRAEGIKIPVIMLTAKSQLDDKVTGLDAGADDYITKPFESKELLARIRAATRRKDTGFKDSVLTFGKLTLNRSAYELSVGEKTQRLGNKEFQIMETFMQNPGGVFSAEKLMEKIWDIDSEAELSVVWVYISGLRKKLVALGAGVNIKAVRGVGYSLEKTDD